MVKQVWVWIALVAGLVLGVFLTTYGAYVLGFSTAESSVRSARATETRESAVDEARMAPTPTPTAGRAGEVRPGFSPPPVTLPAAGPAQTATAPPASVSMVIENAEPEHVDYTNYSGYSLPVDAGPHFGPQIADSIRTGRRDSLTEEHLQLEREVRDDSWSYPLEA